MPLLEHANTCELYVAMTIQIQRACRLHSLVGKADHELPLHLHKGLPLKLHIDVVWLRPIRSSEGRGGEGRGEGRKKKCIG